MPDIQAGIEINSRQNRRSLLVIFSKYSKSMESPEKHYVSKHRSKFSIQLALYVFICFLRLSPSACRFALFTDLLKLLRDHQRSNQIMSPTIELRISDRCNEQAKHERNG
jgi:hypothetical protein